MGLQGYTLFFLFLLKNIDCGDTRRRGGSKEYPQLIFWAEIWKISFFIWKFKFLEIKFSIYLNRRVFVMIFYKETTAGTSCLLPYKPIPFRKGLYFGIKYVFAWVDQAAYISKRLSKVKACDQSSNVISTSQWINKSDRDGFKLY